MQDLIDRITTNIGIEEDLANKSVGMILGYVQSFGEDGIVGNLIEQIPGATELIQEHGAIEAPAEGASSGGIMGMVLGMVSKFTGGESGGVMAIGQNLMAEGLEIGQVKSIATETFAYAKEQAGEDAVNAVTSKIPGLSALL